MKPVARCILSSASSNSHSKSSKCFSVLCAELCCCRAWVPHASRICRADATGACNSSSSSAVAPVVQLNSSQAALCECTAPERAELRTTASCRSTRFVVRSAWAWPRLFACAFLTNCRAPSFSLSCCDATSCRRAASAHARAAHSAARASCFKFARLYCTFSALIWLSVNEPKCVSTACTAASSSLTCCAMNADASADLASSCATRKFCFS